MINTDKNIQVKVKWKEHILSLMGGVDEAGSRGSSGSSIWGCVRQKKSDILWFESVLKAPSSPEILQTL